jgi:hypothetical protein
MTNDVIIVDLKHDGSAWRGRDLISGAGLDPVGKCARALKNLGLPLSTPIVFRRFGKVVKASSIARLTASHNAVSP